jgi:hypothetical protein
VSNFFVRRDLSDIDKDGSLDLEEFCIAMHLTFNCINGNEAPISLPPSLIPANKVHLLPQQQYAQPTGFQQAQSTGYQGYPQAQPAGYQQVQPTGYPQANPTGYQQAQPTGYPQPAPTDYQQPQQTGYYAQPQEPEFSWDMTPEEMTSYQNIYSKYANDTGKVKCMAMSGTQRYSVY